jgi:hypothetical protein
MKKLNREVIGKNSMLSRRAIEEKFMFLRKSTGKFLVICSASFKSNRELKCIFNSLKLYSVMNHCLLIAVLVLFYFAVEVTNSRKRILLEMLIGAQ